MIFQQPIRHELHLLAMPVLLVIGQSDRGVFFRRYAKPEDIRSFGNWPALGRAAVIADGQLGEIEGAGHVSHLEQPQEFLDALTKFLATQM
jgi:pimeloyl-ACP methyl ester carboxylesterase